MSESPRKKIRTADQALVAMPLAKVEAVGRALGPELDPPQPFGKTAYELREGPKLAINDADTGRAKNLHFPPGPITIFISEQKGTMDMMFQCEVTDTKHPHHATLKAAYEELGGGNKTEIEIGPLWSELAKHKAMFPKAAVNLKPLAKLSPEQRLAEIKADFAQVHVNLDGSPEGMKKKTNFCPSTIAIKRAKGEGPPMYTLTVSYRPISKDGDRDAAAGVPLTPRLEAFLAANSAAAIDMKTTPFVTTKGTKLDTGDLLRLPWVVTPSCEFLKIYASATVAIPSVVPSTAYSRFTMSAYLNRARIYGCIGSDNALEEPAVDEDKINSVYDSLYA